MVLTTVWSLIFVGAASLWWRRLRPLGIGALSAGYLLAMGAGLVDCRAVIAIALLIALVWMVKPERSIRWGVAGHVVFLALAFGLGIHVIPGFHNVRAIGPVRFTPDAIPMTMYLNFDKPLAGYWLLLSWPTLSLRRDGWRGVGRGLVIGSATAFVCLGLGVAFGAIAYTPKWPHLGWLWALNNLLLVCMTEEAVFRGYIQDSLRRHFARWRHGDISAIGIAAILFGVAHAAGGVVLVFVSGIAGVGYGLAYRFGGLQAAVVAHFGLNLAHFTLFTYPMLAA